MIRVYCILLLLFITTGPRLSAQSMGTGTITGLVTDPSGASVAGASIVALQMNTNTSRTATTNDEATT
jgi:hypothetical protein